MASTPSFALAQLWPSISGSSVQSRIDQINAMMVAGPNIDIDITDITGYLLLQGVYPILTEFASSATNGTQPHDGALIAAKTFMAWIMLANPPRVNMANPTVFAQFETMANTIVAQETASPGSTGCTQAVLDGLLALAQTTQPWWVANGFTRPVTAADVAAAGLS